MADRFSRFTERARRVLTLAQEEAQRLNHVVIGPEHLLLGLVRESDGVAAKVLLNLGASLEVLRGKVEERVIKGEEPMFGEMALSNLGKKVIELSVKQAKNLNHHYIGTEHLLLGLLSLEGENLAMEVLQECGLSLEIVQKETERILSRSAKGSVEPELIKEEKAKVDAATIATLESVGRFGLQSDPETGFQAEISAKGLSSVIKMRYVRHWRRKQVLVGLLGELIEMIETSESFLPTLPSENGKAWLAYVIWDIWLPVIKDITGITPEDIALAESQLSEAFAKLK